MNRSWNVSWGKLCLRQHAERDAATVENFDRLMAVNARSTMLCYKYAAKQMIAQGSGGRIIGEPFLCP
jgi:NAD(P)-dependent dehydrogenase (short-subunit alcohol dehydrogenase family)